MRGTTNTLERRNENTNYNAAEKVNRLKSGEIGR